MRELAKGKPKRKSEESQPNPMLLKLATTVSYGTGQGSSARSSINAAPMGLCGSPPAIELAQKWDLCSVSWPGVSPSLFLPSSAHLPLTPIQKCPAASQQLILLPGCLDRNLWGQRPRTEWYWAQCGGTLILLMRKCLMTPLALQSIGLNPQISPESMRVFLKPQ